MRKPSAIRRLTKRSNIIADRLRLARRLHEPPLTLQATSELVTAKTGYTITKTMLIRIEGNQRSVYDYEVLALAEALNVDVRFLLGQTEDPATF
ncbi:helix-turn-helix domain-containing protein [Deinococcus taklimakanensis]|uniref:Helix-turn-helix domain-containing protein n=1 Tax=Deinococcus taklimakanensis TaxID=536443 RepID=A0ABW5P220_9DEIO